MSFKLKNQYLSKNMGMNGPLRFSSIIIVNIYEPSPYNFNIFDCSARITRALCDDGEENEADV